MKHYTAVCWGILKEWNEFELRQNLTAHFINEKQGFVDKVMKGLNNGGTFEIRHSSGAVLTIKKVKNNE